MTADRERGEKRNQGSKSEWGIVGNFTQAVCFQMPFSSSWQNNALTFYAAKVVCFISVHITVASKAAGFHACPNVSMYGSPKGSILCPIQKIMLYKTLRFWSPSEESSNDGGTKASMAWVRILNESVCMKVWRAIRHAMSSRLVHYLGTLSWSEEKGSKYILVLTTFGQW